MRALAGLLGALVLVPVGFQAVAQVKVDAGRVAPAFSRPDLNQRQVVLKGYRGKVVLLNFWATWCGPCLAEMPTFAAWQREYGPRGLQVIGVSMDDGEPEVRKAVARLALDYPVVMGDEKIGTAYGGVLGLPVTYLIDREGNIRKRYDGAADLAGIRREVESMLAAR